MVRSGKTAWIKIAVQIHKTAKLKQKCISPADKSTYLNSKGILFILANRKTERHGWECRSRYNSSGILAL